jgi:hypothetical protein
MFYRVMKMALLGFLGLAASLLTGCAEPCNGHIESTVLYFAENPNHQGQLVYANVLNKADLGVQHTLMREDKEYGTFGHIVIIQDPQNQFKGRRSVCFDKFKVLPKPANAKLDEPDIPWIAVVK